MIPGIPAPPGHAGAPLVTSCFNRATGRKYIALLPRIQPDSPLIGGGDIDSLAVMRLVMFIESDLDVTVPLADLTPENFATIKVLSDYLEGRVVGNRTG